MRFSNRRLLLQSSTRDNIWIRAIVSKPFNNVFDHTMGSIPNPRNPIRVRLNQL